jgi:hypothetical protein
MHIRGRYSVVVEVHKLGNKSGPLRHSIGELWMKALLASLVPVGQFILSRWGLTTEVHNVVTVSERMNRELNVIFPDTSLIFRTRILCSSCIYLTPQRQTGTWVWCHSDVRQHCSNQETTVHSLWRSIWAMQSLIQCLQVHLPLSDVNPILLPAHG